VPALDYTASAAAFRRRRTLPAGVLEAWRRAVLGRLPSPPVDRVLDVGSGTGQFSGPLARWTGAAVTALEPSAAMRAEAASGAAADAAAGAAVRSVAGRAEALPVAAGTVDLAWLSTVVHQFDDLATAVAELRRVLRPGGRALVRGYVADQGPIGLLGHFPGIERAIARFPTGAGLAAAFADGGLDPVGGVDVDERWDVDLAAWADGAADIRHADSMFAPLTDDEFAAGVDAVRAEGARRPGVRTVHYPLRLLVFRAPGRQQTRVPV
jgi:SAM-dependent methyltransferase